MLPVWWPWLLPSEEKRRSHVSSIPCGWSSCGCLWKPMQDQIVYSIFLEMHLWNRSFRDWDRQLGIFFQRFWLCCLPCVAWIKLFIIRSGSRLHAHRGMKKGDWWCLLASWTTDVCHNFASSQVIEHKTRETVLASVRLVLTIHHLSIGIH